MWCSCHRLALAYAILEELPGLSTVFKFMKWISFGTERKASHLYIQEIDVKLNRIKEYCETRWLFKGEQIDNIVPQVYYILKYISNNEKARNRFEEYMVDQSYIVKGTLDQTKFIPMLLFVQDLLTYGNSLSKHMQREHGLLPDHLHLVDSLRKFLTKQIARLEKGEVTEFRRLEESKLNYSVIRLEMIEATKMLRDSLFERFITDGKSYNMKKLLKVDGTHICKWNEVVELRKDNDIESLLAPYYLPEFLNEFSEFRSFEGVNVPNSEQEILYKAIKLNKEYIDARVEQRVNSSTKFEFCEPDRRVNLIDCWDIITEDTPYIFLILREIVAIPPTSVLTESTFSRLRNKFIINNKTTTFADRVMLGNCLDTKEYCFSQLHF